MLVLKNIGEIKLVTLIMGAWFVVLCLVAIFTNGTGDIKEDDGKKISDYCAETHKVITPV